ncbi:hypothetical protein C7N43_37510, partial [Sphingobacteriales bacterium UPWRP_1]
MKYCAILLLFIGLTCFAPVPVHASGCYEICAVHQTVVWCSSETPNDKLPLSGITEEEKTWVQYIEGQLYVKLITGANLHIGYKQGQLPGVSRWAKIIPQFGITDIEKAFPRLPQMNQYYRIRFTNTALTQQLIDQLQRYPYVQFAEKVPLHRTFLTPNDIHPNQYNVLITQAEQAWDITTGNANIVIGMVD